MDFFYSVMLNLIVVIQSLQMIEILMVVVPILQMIWNPMVMDIVKMQVMKNVAKWLKRVCQFLVNLEKNRVSDGMAHNIS